MKMDRHIYSVGLALLLLLLALGGCVFNFGGCSCRSLYENVVHLEHAAMAGGQLMATTSSGNIEVTGQDTAICTVEAKIQVRACSEEKAQELGEQVRVTLTPTTEGLVLATEQPQKPRCCSISVHYKIITPHATHITAKSSSGNATLRHLIGNTEVKVSSGNLHLHDISQGRLYARSSSGNVTLAQGQDLSDCTLHTSSGNVKAETVSADSLDLQSSSGNVTAAEATCDRIKAHSSSGNVKANLTSESPGTIHADLATSSGNVTATLPPHFAGKVELGTNSGSIHIDYPVTMTITDGKINKRHIVGQVGEGSGWLRAKTSSGNVKIY